MTTIAVAVAVAVGFSSFSFPFVGAYLWSFSSRFCKCCPKAKAKNTAQIILELRNSCIVMLSPDNLSAAMLAVQRLIMEW